MKVSQENSIHKLILNSLKQYRNKAKQKHLTDEKTKDFDMPEMYL